METPNATRGTRSVGAIATLVALAAALPFLPTLRASFIYDDTTLLRDNATLRGWHALTRVWSAPYWPGGGPTVIALYRPFHVALLSAIWNLGGGSPLPFHLYALALHVVVAVLVWRLLRRGVALAAAAGAALWFATHALHVEAIASVMNTSELLVVACTIALAMLLAQRSTSDRGAARDWLRALGAAALVAAALLSKESGLLALPVAAITAWGWRAPSETTVDARRFVAENSRVWLAGIATIVAVLLARAAVLGGAASTASLVAPGMPTEARARIEVMLSLWPRIAGMLLWPTALSPYYGPTVLPRHAAIMATLGIVGALALVALAAVNARRGDRRLLVAVGWIALTYFPASNLVAASGPFIADRILFPVTVGVALAIGWLLDRAASRARALLLVVCLALAARNAVTTARYATVWTSHRTLWQSLVTTSPREYRGYLLLGVDARERGDTATEFSMLARAFAMEPRDRRVRFEHGQALYAEGKFAESATVLAPLLRDGDVRREPGFVAMYLDAVGRSRGADGVIAAGKPLLRTEAAAPAALYVGAAEELLGRSAAADSIYEIGLRAAPRDSLLLARRAALRAASSGGAPKPMTGTRP